MIRFLILLLFPVSIFAGVPEKTVPSTIQSVTVFLNGAQVNRQAETMLTQGNTILKFEGISQEIDVQSVQIQGEGDFTIQSVVHKINFLKSMEKKEELEGLIAKQKILQNGISIESAMHDVFQKEETMILANQSIGGQQTGVRIEELKQAADFYRKRLGEISREKLNIAVKKDSLQTEIKSLDNQIKELKVKGTEASSELYVAVNAKTSVTAKFLISYLVKKAGWFPTYDIRVKSVNDPVTLVYKANVYQSSGVDWEQVKLTISSGDPKKGGTKPDLKPWRLSFNQRFANRSNIGFSPDYAGNNLIRGIVKDDTGEPLPFANVLVQGSTVGTTTDFNGEFSINIPSGGATLQVSYIGYENHMIQIPSSGYAEIIMNENSALLQEVVVTELTSKSSGVSIRGSREKTSEYTVPLEVTEIINTTSVDFEIDLPYHIPADGKSYTVDMVSHSVDAYYEYYAAPKLDKDAFLTARIAEWEEYNLLAGEANLYFEGKYLGKSLLDVSVVTDTLDLSLGRDKNIVVNRIKEKEFSKKRFLGSKVKQSIAWDIQVRSKKQESINLVLEDQVPVSTTSDISVENIVSPGAEYNSETGILTWNLQLTASENKDLGFSYEVKYPKDRTLYLE